MEDPTSTKAYYESIIEELKLQSKPKLKLSNEDIQELAVSIADSIGQLDCWNENYDIVFNKIHEKYGI